MSRKEKYNYRLIFFLVIRITTLRKFAKLLKIWGVGVSGLGVGMSGFRNGKRDQG